MKNLSRFDDKYLRRSLYFHNIFKQISELEGNIVECGVGAGDGLCTFLSLHSLENKSREIWGFDTFEGFPEFSEADNKEIETSNRLNHYVEYTEDFIKNKMIEFGLSERDVKENIVLAKGLIPESLEKYNSKPISFLHLDLDLYDPYKHSLKFFYPLVETGGVIAFDEYDKPNDLIKWPGAKKGIDEAIEELGINPTLNKCELSGNTFIVKD